MKPVDPSFSSSLAISGSNITGSFQADTESASFNLVRQSSNQQVLADVTGWWSGVMIDTLSWGAGSPKSCAGGQPATFTTNSPLILAIAYNDSNFAGSMTFQHDWHDHMFGDGTCMWIDSGSVSIPVSGTVSGSAIIMQPIDSSFSSTLSVANSTITGNFRSDTQSASFTLINQIAAPSRRRTAQH
jgi:hypothetical protein